MTQVEFRSHFSGKKSVSYGPGNTVIQNTHTSGDTFDGARPKEYGRAAMTKLSGTQYTKYTMSYEI
jgi:hypothetical protein